MLAPLKQTISTTTFNDMAVIVLLYHNPDFKGFSKSFDLEICGKKMWKFVEMACGDFPIKTAICTPQTDVFELVRPMLTDAKFTLVLYSDTPLLQKSTIHEIAAFATVRDINFVNLLRGFVCKTEFLKTTQQMPSAPTEYFGEDDFVTAFDARQLEFVSQIMKSRIIEFHQKNGVYIMDTGSTFIDADVVIESGVTIYPHNHILGSSVIKRATKLMPFNVVDCSVVGAGCVLKGAHLYNAKIDDGKVVNAFENVE